MLASPAPLTHLLHRQVLVVEDEFMQAEDLRQDLETYGAAVVGPVNDVEEALRRIWETPDLAAAVLDVDLRGEVSYLIADTLRRRGIPFVFVTGFDRKDLPARYHDVPLVLKPSPTETVVEALVA